MPSYAVPVSPAAALPIIGSRQLFPVHHVYAVTRNYGSAETGSGGAGARALPAIFTKAPDSVIPSGSSLPYPPETRQLEPEVELVIALAGGGGGLDPEAAGAIIFGYGVGLDMTRRDLQRMAREEGKPWDTAKWFTGASPVSDIRPAAEVETPDQGLISLDLNGRRVQEGRLSDMIWKAEEVVAILSRFVTLCPGDLIFTGTPPGECILQPGDHLEGRIEGVGALSLDIDPAESGGDGQGEQQDRNEDRRR